MLIEDGLKYDFGQYSVIANNYAVLDEGEHQYQIKVYYKDELRFTGYSANKLSQNDIFDVLFDNAFKIEGFERKVILWGLWLAMEEKCCLIDREWSIGEFKFILNQPIEKELLKYKTYIKMHNVTLNCIKTA